MGKKYFNMKKNLKLILKDMERKENREKIEEKCLKMKKYLQWEEQ